MDFEGAYYSLWAAKDYSDSLYNANYLKSATKAQMDFLERKSKENFILAQNKKMLVWVIVLIFTIIILISLFIFSKLKRDTIEEKGRMEIIIDSLKEQIGNLESENKVKDVKIDKLARNHTKTIFSPLANIYETLMPYLNSSEIDVAKVYNVIEKKVNTLNSDTNIHALFEEELNKNLQDIMIHFRQDFPDLSVDDHKMASYIFAGMDNTNIMLLMHITTLENTRVKKNRLKKKILNSSIEDKERYLMFF